MQVNNSIIALTSTREYSQSLQRNSQLNAWNNESVSSNSRKMPAKIEPVETGSEVASGSTSLDPEINTLKLVLEALTGKKINLADPGSFDISHEAVPDKTALKERPDEPEMLGWGVDYHEQTTITETEKNTVTASGIINRKDGKRIQFSINLSVEREFSASSDFSFKAGDALIDPLVVNLGNNSVDLTDTRFKFDINSDGKTEALSWLKGASGFLVLDKNSDGIVNNGTELFGPETGNGFDELARLDYDKNGFIDENDPGFTSLKLWTGKTAEKSSLNDLKHHKIGAIALLNIDSMFSVTDDENNTKGKIQKTGIYLKENGTAGTIQQIDLAV